MDFLYEIVQLDFTIGLFLIFYFFHIPRCNDAGRKSNNRYTKDGGNHRDNATDSRDRVQVTVTDGGQ